MHLESEVDGNKVHHFFIFVLYAICMVLVWWWLCICSILCTLIYFSGSHLNLFSFIAVEPIDSYCVLISSKVVYFLKPGEYVDRESIFLEVKYDDLYHCLVSKDRGKVYVQLTKKAENTTSGLAIPGPSHQKPMVRKQYSG